MQINKLSTENRAQAAPQRAADARPAVTEQPTIATDGHDGAGSKDPGDVILRAKIDEMNARFSAIGQEIAFEYNNDSRKVVVRVIDKQTQQVLRQMPSAEALNLALTLDAHIGKVIRENV